MSLQSIPNGILGDAESPGERSVALSQPFEGGDSHNVVLVEQSHGTPHGGILPRREVVCQTGVATTWHHDHHEAKQRCPTLLRAIACFRRRFSPPVGERESPPAVKTVGAQQFGFINAQNYGFADTKGLGIGLKQPVSALVRKRQLV